MNFLKIIKYIGIALLVLSYSVFIWNLVANGTHQEFTKLLNTAWLLGTLSVIVNAVYAIKINVSDFALSLFGFCGLIWFAPFLIDYNTSFGLVSLIAYFILTIYIHLQDKAPSKDV